jgi:hypothetical protein
MPVASQNLIHAKSKQHPESRATAAPVGNIATLSVLGWLHHH